MYVRTITQHQRCERRAKAAGLCTTHYARARKHGEPLEESTSHPKGQRIQEKVQHAVEVLRRYAPDLLK